MVITYRAARNGPVPDGAHHYSRRTNPAQAPIFARTLTHLDTHTTHLLDITYLPDLPCLSRCAVIGSATWRSVLDVITSELRLSFTRRSNSQDLCVLLPSVSTIACLWCRAPLRLAGHLPATGRPL